MKGEAGKSVSIDYTVDNDPQSAHTLKKEGIEVAQTRYEVRESEIVLHKVSVEDRGTYTISCENQAGVGSADFVLDISPAKEPPPIFTKGLSFGSNSAEPDSFIFHRSTTTIPSPLYNCDWRSWQECVCEIHC